MKILKGDALVRLPEMKENSVDAIVTDPPYELGFMGKSWDNSGAAYSVKMWTEALRVLKPGGHLLAFGGSRTYHRLACAIEDAGFEIRDQIQWVYGSGMPKSHNLKRYDLCLCGGNAVQSTHAEQNTEHDLRPLQEGDIQASEFAVEKHKQVLRAYMPVQGQTESLLRPEGTESEIGGKEQPCVERGQICRAGERLRNGTQARSSKGATERVCSGAHPGRGGDVGTAAERPGGSAPPRFESSEQQTPQSENLCNSPRALDGRALSNSGCCARCGKLKKEYEGFGSALKPAHEPIVVARKPLEGTVAANVLKWGTGAVNIDGCRVHADDAKGYAYAVTRLKPGATLNKTGGNWRPEEGGIEYNGQTQDGRWPANLIHDGSEEVLSAFPNAPGQLADVKYDADERKTQNIYGAMKRGHEPSADRTYEEKGSTNFAMKPGARRLDQGSAARFFMKCEFSEIEKVFCRAKAIMQSWNLEFVNTADHDSDLSNRHVVSVLKHAVIVAALGAKQLSDVKGLSIPVTVFECEKLSETLIGTILLSEKESSLASLLDEPFPNGCLVSCVETQGQIGITQITISRWRSDGSADPATFSITQLNWEVGEAVSRIKYCAKASKAERGKDNKHPTVKPIALMRYLCRLVTPPGGLILDPFCGSGTTGIAAMREGFDFIGIDDTEEYAIFSENRLLAEVLS